MFILILFISGVYSLPIINKDVRMAMEHLQTFGYAVNVKVLVHESTLVEPLKQYQMNMGLNITGIVDAATIDLMKKPRCGMLDTKSRPVMTPVDRTGNIQYTYKITQYPRGVYEVPIDEEIEAAFNIWSKYSNLLFVRRKRQEQINIAFFVGNHIVDKYAFDGPGNVTAHASSDPMYIHFDEDELWTNSNIGYKSINIFQIAAHEIGHVLGLDHSNYTDSIMYAYYLGYNEHFRKALHPEDIENVQKISGKRSNADRSTSQDIHNPLNFNVIFRMNDNTTYTLFDTTYIAYDINMMEIERGNITDKWKYLPAMVDAAFQATDGKVYFFKGRNYWRYMGKNLDPTFPNYISDGFSDIKNVDCAVLFKKTVLFFEYQTFHEYNHEGGTITQLSISSHWPGIPNYINSIININDRKLYFFRKKYYYIFDVATRQSENHTIGHFFDSSK